MFNDCVGQLCNLNIAINMKRPSRVHYMTAVSKQTINFWLCPIVDRQSQILRRLSARLIKDYDRLSVDQA